MHKCHSCQPPPWPSPDSRASAEGEKHTGTWQKSISSINGLKDQQDTSVPKRVATENLKWQKAGQGPHLTSSSKWVGEPDYRRQDRRWARVPREIGISVSVFVPGPQLRSLAVVVPLYNRRISICRQFGIGPGSFLHHNCHYNAAYSILKMSWQFFSNSWSYCQHWPFLVNFHSPLAITGQLFENSQIVNAFNSCG